MCWWCSWWSERGCQGFHKEAWWEWDQVHNTWHCWLFLRQIHQWQTQKLATDFQRKRYQGKQLGLEEETTAVFCYAIGSRKLSANEQFFCWCLNRSKFVTNSSNKRRRVIYSRANKVYTSTNKTTIVWIETELFSFFLFFFTRDGCVSCLRACFGARLLLPSY